MRRSLGRFGLACLASSSAACARPSEVPGTQVSMSFAADAPLYDAPFPGVHLRDANGRVHLEKWPNPLGVELISKLRLVLSGKDQGFGTTSGIFFAASAAIDPSSLPSVAGSITATASVFLACVDDRCDRALGRHPVEVRFSADGGPHGAPNLISVLPVQGLPLQPGVRWAAVVTRSVRDASGAQLGVGLGMAELAAGETPAGMSEAAADAYHDALERLGLDAEQVAAISVIETEDPTALLAAMVSRVGAADVPALKSAPVLGETFDDFCVYDARIEMPVYQRGEPPYTESGGDFQLDAAGMPILQRMEEAKVVITIPRREMPAAGYPIVVFMRVGGGGERPLVDRGVHAVAHGQATAPGSGPALTFARAGFAGISVDGPHGGLRNITHDDEQFLVFNITNPAALRDNIRQSAFEAALTARVLESVAVDVSGCAGATGAPARFDLAHLALMGHSMGATIAPLAAAVEPRYRALILNGAGSSYIENLVWKRSPLPVKGVAEVVLRFDTIGRSLTEHDPVASLVQWAGDVADPPPYGRLLRGRAGGPPAILMFQGVIDTYIPAQIANPTSLGLGLDLAAPALEESLIPLLRYTGRSVVALPAPGNVVVQHPEDGIEDGHEIVFQREEPKRQYGCFLTSFARGAPVVPRADGSCP